MHTSLQVLDSESFKALEFTQENFDRAVKARHALLFALAFEQRIDLALENFAELEKCVLEMALRNAIFKGESPSRLSQGRHVINRVLVNFMSSAKLYVDQTSHALSEMFGTESNQRISFIEATNREFDARLGYRVFEALRNYSQHRGLPAHTITFSSSKNDRDDGLPQSRNAVSFGLNPSYLREDGGFRKSTLAELEATADRKGRVQLMPLAREYISGLACVHRSCQEHAQSSFDDADSAIEEVLDYAEQQLSETPRLVQAVKVRPDGTEIRESISANLTAERNEFEKKNMFAAHIDKQYVTS